MLTAGYVQESSMCCWFKQMRAEELKRSWRAAQRCHSERPGDATHEGAASVAVKTAGLKGSWGEADTWAKVGVLKEGKGIHS